MKDTEDGHSGGDSGDHQSLESKIENGLITMKELKDAGWKSAYGVISASTEKITMPMVQSVVDGFRQSVNQNWFAKVGSRELFHPALVEKVLEKIKERGEKAPVGWKTAFLLAQDLQVDSTTINKIVDKYRLSNPDWFHGYLDGINRLRVYFHPDLVKIIADDIRGRGEKMPVGWNTSAGVGIELGKDRKTILKWAQRYRKEHPDWFAPFVIHGSQPVEGYHPDLIERLRARSIETETQHRIEDELVEFVGDVKNGTTEEALDFRSVLNIFGASRCVDIIFRFRPEFKSLPVDHVKGILAEYLGDFLSVKSFFSTHDVFVAVNKLGDALREQTLQDILFEAIKDDCLRYYLRHSHGEDKRGRQIVLDYLDHITNTLGVLKNKNVDDVVEKVVLYFDGVVGIRATNNMIDHLDEGGREFPDINQKVNIKELEEKRQFLIADEMGLGKSASVLIAKERLGIKSALIVAPNNVINVWQKFLSDDRGKGGYFKEGKAPHVLVLEDPSDVSKLPLGDYDYVLISQEKLNENYLSGLQESQFGMVIVDEVHKLESTVGKRANNLLSLTNGIEERQGYLALLSGTPIPNKIVDVAMLLKMLYPKQFGSMENKELVAQIVDSDLIDLRSLLLPKMQLKELKESLELPPLEEDICNVELGQLESTIYEVLLEEDELSASQKMMLLRRFLLNPELIDSTPGVESSKINAVGKELCGAFDTHQKVVMFINDYVEGVIRGEKDIIAKLGLPSDVEVEVIHGEVPAKDRERIQSQLGVDGRKILLLVSGQTADVGVDFSKADRVFFYNEPWTEYQRRQELGRVYRPGIKHDLKSTTFITSATIEQGIHEYILRKYKAVEKLLRGVPITDLEKELLLKDEQSEQPDLSVNPELAEYYFSTWDKMMKIFGYIKEIGERSFSQFLDEYANDYAEGYQQLGNRCYQANANRVVGTIISKLTEQSGLDLQKLLVVDLASGPEMLKRHMSDKFKDRIVSMDMNYAHFSQPDEHGNGPDLSSRRKAFTGSLTDLPFGDGMFDFANLSLALHYTNFVPSKQKFERLQVLLEISRVLKDGGRVLINNIYSLGLKDEKKFFEVMEELGFKVMDGYTGDVSSGDSYKSHLITLEKIGSIPKELNVKDLAERIGKEGLEGLKFKSIPDRLKDSRKILSEFRIGDTNLGVELNEQDRLALEEEKQLTTIGEGLKQRYRGIKNIPANEIIENNFVRFRMGERYILFRKMKYGSGVVIIK